MLDYGGLVFGEQAFTVCLVWEIDNDKLDDCFSVVIRCDSA
jgi:hypothetical protein